MKKVKLLLSLFMAFIGLSASHAEVVTTTPVQDGSEITEGYYVIRSNSNFGNGKIKILPKNGYTKWSKPDATDETMVWKLTDNGEGTFILKHVVTQMYLGKMKNGGGLTATGSPTFTMSTNGTENPVTITLLGQSEEETNKGEYQYQITTKDRGIFHCEASSWDEAFVVSYSGGVNSASGWCFEKVDNTKGDQLDEHYANAVSQITIKKIDEKGVVFETLSTKITKGESYTFNPETSYYTHVSTSVDGVVTEATEFETVNSAHTIEYKYTWNLPFESSEITGSEFPAGTKWYRLKLRDNYITYNAATPDYIARAENKGNGDEYWWTFKGDYQNGIQVYNKAAGATKIMTSVSPAGAESKTYPHFEDANGLGEDKNTTWTIYPSKDYPQDNGFYLSRKGETTKINLNMGDGKLVYWTGQDIGSTFRVESIENELSVLAEDAPEGIYAVGTINQDIRPTYNEHLAKKSPEGFRAALEISNDDANFIQLNTNNYYRLQNVLRRGLLQIDESTLRLSQNQKEIQSDGNKIWKIEQSDSNVKILHANAQMRATAPGTAKLTDDGETYTMEDWGNGQFGFKSGQNYLVQYGGGGIGGWTSAAKGGDQLWYILPAEDIELTITDAGYATINYPFAVELQDGLTAYTGGTISDNQIVLNAVEGRIIPANSPVILAGTAGTYTLTILPENTDAALASSLQRTLLSQTIDDATTAYVLAKPETKKVGFYLLESGETADRTIGANKAYLTVAAASIKAFTFDFGGTTGIENTEAVTETEEYYDLQGRRVMNPTKGIYVTKSGKKVLFTK